MCEKKELPNNPENHVENILKIIKFFDDARWEHLNKWEINHESFIKKINDNGMILTHWLRYITNRNMNADKLWEKASRCLSEIIKNIQDDKDDAEIIKKYLSIKDQYKDTSLFRFIEKDEINNYRFIYHINGKEKLFSSRYYPSDYYSIISTLEILKHKNINFSIGNFLSKIFEKIKDDDENLIIQKIVFSLYLLTYFYNPQLQKEDIETDLEDFDVFRMAEERAKIVIEIIEDKEIFDYSFSNFINVKKKVPANFNNFILKTESSFINLNNWQLLQTYKRKKEKDGGKNIKLKYENIIDDFNKNKKDETIENSNAYKLLFNRSDKLFHEKRIWCALRDFFKNTEFKELLIKTINNENLKKILFNNNNEPNPKILKQFELPGDLWNNRFVFWECTDFLLKKKNNDYFKFEDYRKNQQDEENEDDKNKIKPAKMLRDTVDYFYENKSDPQEIFYPEQFDITFDYIRRMCESNNCDICPVGKLKSNTSKKGENFFKMCSKTEGAYCPVVAIACNYKFECKGEAECNLLKVINI